MIEYVLIGKHLVSNPDNSKWIVSRGSKKLIELAKGFREQEHNSSEVEYKAMTLKAYLTSIK